MDNRRFGKNLSASLLAVGAAGYAASRMLRRRRRIDLAGKVVLITGGSRGLGLAMALEAGKRGARIAICGRDNETLQRASELLRTETGRSPLAIQVNLINAGAAEELARQVERQLGPIDVLINSAGRIEVGPIETTVIADYEKAMATHFRAPLELVQACLPCMKQRGSGRIVNISSIGGRIGVPHLVPYDASKFALAGYSEALTAEVRRFGIRVTTVFPGLMRTGSPRNANFKGQHTKEYAWFAVSDATPLLTVGAKRAARKIIDACIHGDTTLVLTPAAKLGILAHDLAPDLVINLLAFVNSLLPEGGGTEVFKGRDSESAVTRSPLTALNRKAERDLNQVS